jgi:hypothetical protein
VTIDEHLRQYPRRYLNRLALFLVAGSTLLTLANSSFVLRFAASVVMLVVVLAAVVSLFQIPCPNCRKPLGRIGFLAAHAGSPDASRRCPNCNIAFNEQMPAGTATH